MSKFYKLLESINAYSPTQVYWHGGTSKDGIFTKTPLAGITPVTLKTGLSMLDLTDYQTFKDEGYESEDTYSGEPDLRVYDLRSGSEKLKEYSKEYDLVKFWDTPASNRGTMKTIAVFDSDNLILAPKQTYAWHEEGEGESINDSYYDYKIGGY